MRLVCESSSWVLTCCSYPFLFPLLIPSSTELWNCSLKQPEGFDRRWRNSCFRFRLCSVSLKQAKSIHGDAECSCYRPIYWWVKHSWGQGCRAPLPSEECIKVGANDTTKVSDLNPLPELTQSFRVRENIHACLNSETTWRFSQQMKKRFFCLLIQYAPCFSTGLKAFMMMLNVPAALVLAHTDE